MPRNDGVDARKLRIHQVVEKIVALLNENGDVEWISLKRTFAEIEWETGLTRQKILAYASSGVERGIYVLDEKNDQIRKAES